GEPLERRRLTNGLPDPEPFDHVQGQDSYITLKERIAARVRRFSDLFWPENGAPYIKPAESVPQKYYQMLTQDNYEALMAKAWRMGAKRLQDHDLIVLNLFVYLKDKNPLDPAARPAPRESRCVLHNATYIGHDVPHPQDGAHTDLRLDQARKADCATVWLIRLTSPASYHRCFLVIIINNYQSPGDTDNYAHSAAKPDHQLCISTVIYYSSHPSSKNTLSLRSAPSQHNAKHQPSNANTPTSSNTLHVCGPTHRQPGWPQYE
ncbi:hypothetical protein EC991_008527, partial [Linnemannia zychae]